MALGAYDGGGEDEAALLSRQCLVSWPLSCCTQGVLKSLRYTRQYSIQYRDIPVGTSAVGFGRMARIDEAACSAE